MHKLKHILSEKYIIITLSCIILVSFFWYISYLSYNSQEPVITDNLHSEIHTQDQDWEIFNPDSLTDNTLDIDTQEISTDITVPEYVKVYDFSTDTIVSVALKDLIVEIQSVDELPRDTIFHLSIDGTDALFYAEDNFMKLYRLSLEVEEGVDTNFLHRTNRRYMPRLDVLQYRDLNYQIDLQTRKILQIERLEDYSGFLRFQSNVSFVRRYGTSVLTDVIKKCSHDCQDNHDYWKRVFSWRISLGIYDLENAREDILLSSDDISDGMYAWFTVIDDDIYVLVYRESDAYIWLLDIETKYIELIVTIPEHLAFRETFFPTHQKVISRLLFWDKQNNRFLLASWTEFIVINQGGYIFSGDPDISKDGLEIIIEALEYYLEPQKEDPRRRYINFPWLFRLDSVDRYNDVYPYVIILENLRIPESYVHRYSWRFSTY